MVKAKNGDKVSVHYIGKLNDGTIFDDSYGGETLDFTIGENMLLPDFENGVIGMGAGEKKLIIVLAENAYGEYDDTLVFGIKKENLHDTEHLQIGDELQMVSEEEGETIDLVVTEIEDDMVTVDANHELAGEDLNFEIELININ